MAKLHLNVNNEIETTYVFVCLACGNCHWIRTKGKQPIWTLTGLENNEPTISQSILVRGTVPITDEEADRIMHGEKIIPKPLVCHSFVRNGKIEYLSDCSHGYAGKSIELPDFDKWVAGNETIY